MSSHRPSWKTWSIPPLLALSACAQPALELHVSQTDSRVSSTSLALRATQAETGEVVDLGDAQINVEVAEGEGWSSVGTEVKSADKARLDVVLVVDNSGSQASDEERIREAVRAFGHKLFDLTDFARVGLVRVSTESTVVSELTADRAQLDASLEKLFISNGYTALYDGVRLANEVLQRGYEPDDPCTTPVFRGVVVFTDGRDNNSADEHDTRYEGDGIDTSYGMLTQLKVGDARTPIFSVGVGDRVDEATLWDLADDTGGLYAAIKNYQKLQGALVGTAHSLWNARFVCVPGKHERVRVKLTTDDGEESEVIVVI